MVTRGSFRHVHALALARTVRVPKRPAQKPSKPCSLSRELKILEVHLALVSGGFLIFSRSAAAQRCFENHQ